MIKVCGWINSHSLMNLKPQCLLMHNISIIPDNLSILRQSWDFWRPFLGLKQADSWNGSCLTGWKDWVWTWVADNWFQVVSDILIQKQPHLSKNYQYPAEYSPKYHLKLLESISPYGLFEKRDTDSLRKKPNECARMLWALKRILSMILH